MTNVLGRNWREMKFPPGPKLRERCGGLPSECQELCSKYKRQHVPKPFWTEATGPFSTLFIARAIKVVNSHAKCHPTPPVPFQKWYLQSCFPVTVRSAKVNRRVKKSSSSLSLSVAWRIRMTSSTMQPSCIKYNTTVLPNKCQHLLLWVRSNLEGHLHWHTTLRTHYRHL